MALFHSRSFLGPILFGLLFCSSSIFFALEITDRFHQIFLSAFFLLLVLITEITRIKKVVITHTDIWVIVYCVYLLLNSLFVCNLPVDPLEFLLGCVLILVYVTVRCFNETNLKIVFGFILASAMIEAVIGLLQQGLLLFSNNYFFNMTGSFDNPGPFGGYLAVCLTVSTCICILYSRYMNQRGILWWIGFISIPLIGIALILSDSRAAWLAFLIPVLSLLYKLVSKKN